MPNHVTNILHINGTPEQVKEVRDAISGVDDEGEPLAIIFDKIDPMPDELNVTSSHESRVAAQEMGMPSRFGFNMERRPSDDVALIETCKENIRKHGHPTWYEWRVENWGTKWGAYDIVAEEGSNKIRFDTAWSVPAPWLTKLAAKFPEVEFKIVYADEDVGSNCGTLTFRDGALVHEEHPHGRDAELFAYKVKGYSDEEIAEREQEAADS